MDPVEALAQRVGEVLGDGPPQERRIALRKRIVTDAPRRGPLRASGLTARWLLATLGAVALIVAVFFWRAFESGPLQVTIDQHVVVVGEFLEASTGPIELNFEDGTNIELSAGSRGRLMDLERDRVGLQLDSGSLNARVRRETGAEWAVMAGPFKVAVIGTVFSVDWHPEERELGVRVLDGVVSVSGGTLGSEGVRVRAGHVLTLESDGSATLSKLREPSRLSRDEPSKPEVRPSSPPASSAPPDVKPPPSAAGGRAAPSAIKPTDPDWISLARVGDYPEALQQAETIGFDELLTTLGESDLKLLADTARYAGSASRATQSLTALRKRFPTSTQGRLASFLLGRVFAESGNSAQAARWFAVYLRESPSGSMTAEARGRLMQAYAQSGDRVSARRAARAYLKLHSEGPYAAAARGLLEGGRLK